MMTMNFMYISLLDIGKMSLEIPVCDFEHKIDAERESDVKILMLEQADYRNVGLKTLLQHYGREKT